MASFTTKFSFEITPNTSNSPYIGDGMAFFLAASPEMPPDSHGQNLGLLPFPFPGSTTSLKDERRFVAVEFDTFLNPETDDQSANHIGIDVNSVNSTAYKDTTSLTRNLTSGFLMVATVTYDNLSRFLDVHLQIKEITYQVSKIVDMRWNLPQEVAVGFSAATADAAELHRIMSWSFRSSLEAKKPAMAPAPGLEPHGPPPTTSSTSKHRTKVGILLTVLVPLLFLFLCAAAGFLLWRRRIIEATESDSEEQHKRAELERGITANGPRRYTYRELGTATNNFAQEAKLGQGGFGSVYRGHLIVGEQDQAVVIKMLSTDSSTQGRKEFEAEVRIISQLKHRNLVHLLGWCDSREGLLVVYELVAEGTLDKHLYDSERLLTWPERYKIILGLGSSLRYLHGEWKQCVLHGDIKPSNIMLDSSYMTKLGDFGLARLVDHGTQGQTTHVLMGAAGYIDPAFFNTCRRSTESDVYSFGIVLLEIVSGRRPVLGTGTTSGEVFKLLPWVWSLYGRNAILDAVDERLRGDEDEEWWMVRVLLVGLLCAQDDQSERPSVAQAMHVLQSRDARLPALPLHLFRAVPDQLAVAAAGSPSSTALLSEMSRI